MNGLAYFAYKMKRTGTSFLLLPFSRGIWVAVYHWIGKSIPVGAVGWHHILLFGDLMKLSKGGGRVSAVDLVSNYVEYLAA
jgi:hypothetical protein